MAEWNCFKCKNEDDIALCSRCEDGSEYIIKTNADRIRSMTDEELAEFLSEQCGFSTRRWNEWLQKDSEV